MGCPIRLGTLFIVINLNIMKKFLMAVCCMASLSSVAQGLKYSPFQKFDNWNQVTNHAEKTGKKIFIDAYATWCGPCKQMDEEVFANVSFAEYLFNEFIPVKVQMDQTKSDDPQVKAWYNDAKMLSDRYHVTAFPTYIILAPDGQLMQVIRGYHELDAFTALVKNAADPKHGYAINLAEFADGRIPLPDQAALALRAKEFKDDSIAYVIAKSYKTKYLDRQPILSIINPDLPAFTGNFPDLFSINDPLLNLCYREPVLIDSLVQSEGYAKMMVRVFISRSIVMPHLDNAEKGNASPNWDSLEKKVAKRFDRTLSKSIILDNKIYWYRKRSDWDNTIKYEIEKIEVNGIDTAGLGKSFLNNLVYSVIFQHSSNPEYLEKGLKFMDVLLKVNPEKDSWLDTYANLLYKLGKKDQALRYQEKALAIAKGRNDELNVTEYTTTLKKMRNDLPTWREN